jgi:hypothetical protein
VPVLHTKLSDLPLQRIQTEWSWKFQPQQSHPVDKPLKMIPAQPHLPLPHQHGLEKAVAIPETAVISP